MDKHSRIFKTLLCGETFPLIAKLEETGNSGTSDFQSREYDSFSLTFNLLFSSGVGG